MADGTTYGFSRMGTLTAAVTMLFAEAAGLPDPGSLTVYGVLDGHVHDEVAMQFPPVAESTEAVVEWALRFGGVIQSTPLNDEHGRSQYVRAEFTWQEFLRVQVFAVSPLPETEAITSAEPETVTPF